MLMQNRIETYCLSGDEAIVYRITNDVDPFIFHDGDPAYPGLKIKLSGISHERWVSEIWPQARVECIDNSGSNGELIDKLVGEIVFGLMSGKHNCIGGWKITSVNFWTNGQLTLDLHNQFNEELSNFMACCRDDYGGWTHESLVAAGGLPSSYYSISFHMNEEQNLYLAIEPSDSDKCEYGLSLTKDRFSVTEKSASHLREIEFGSSIEKTIDGEERAIYKAEIREAILH